MEEASVTPGEMMGEPLEEPLLELAWSLLLLAEAEAAAAATAAAVAELELGIVAVPMALMT